MLKEFFLFLKKSTMNYEKNIKNISVNIFDRLLLHD